MQGTKIVILCASALQIVPKTEIQPKCSTKKNKVGSSRQNIRPRIQTKPRLASTPYSNQKPFTNSHKNGVSFRIRHKNEVLPRVLLSEQEKLAAYIFCFGVCFHKPQYHGPPKCIGGRIGQRGEHGGVNS